MFQESTGYTSMVRGGTEEKVTMILGQMRAGDRDAAARLVPLVYEELRAIAQGHLKRERPGHSLQPTALVNEVWLHFMKGADLDLSNRSHFLAVAANAMRRLLIDHARARGAAKRGGGWERVSLSVQAGRSQGKGDDVDVVALHEALNRLEQLGERLARVVELRFFGGLTVQEVAEVLGVAPVTVEKDWTKAKAWLRRELRGG
jgi:RNA polymerase sigma factor (TIGR02999 family)